ncbi:MAG: hypothetical protein KDF60_01670 [Calditrichaeota bacterium]|nr:hypothetical protein [Calditrichota bacterium]
MRKYLVLLLFILTPAMGFSQLYDYLEDDPAPTIKKHRGLAYSLLETGSGLGVFYEIPFMNFMHWGAEFDAFMLRDKNEFGYTDYYGYYRTIGKENNVYLFDLMFTLKQRLFAEDFDDSFRPFITASIGPVFGMNFPEFDRDADGQKLKDQYLWTLGGIIGMGLDADVDGKYYFGLRTQYRILPFSERLGERKNHSMIDVRLEIGQRF